MPIIKPRPNRVRHMRQVCRLEEPNRDALVLYARFIGESVDYVINQLIEATLVKDRDFLASRGEHSQEATAVVPPGRLPATQDPAPTHVNGNRTVMRRMAPGWTGGRRGPRARFLSMRSDVRFWAASRVATSAASGIGYGGL